MKEKKIFPDPNLISYSIDSFVEYYNKNIPASFPRVTVDDLVSFKQTHQSLFVGKGDWTIDKHRKKLMDWISSRRKR